MIVSSTDTRMIRSNVIIIVIISIIIVNVMIIIIINIVFQEVRASTERITVISIVVIIPAKKTNSAKSHQDTFEGSETIVIPCSNEHGHLRWRSNHCNSKLNRTRILLTAAKPL